MTRLYRLFAGVASLIPGAANQAPNDCRNRNKTRNFASFFSANSGALPWYNYECSSGV